MSYSGSGSAPPGLVGDVSGDGACGYSRKPQAKGENGGVRPPGSLASTVEVKTLWNSMMRWLQTSHCGPLRSFFHSFCSSQTRRGSKPCTFGPVWPMPLPYLLGKKGNTVEASHKRAVNTMIILLSWLHLGQPSRVPADFKANAKLSGEERGVVRRLERLSAAWVGATAVDAEAMGRAASKIETMEATVASLTKHASALQEKHGSGGLFPGGANVAADLGRHLQTTKSGEVQSEVQVAKEIEAERLTFGGRPTFDPSPFLDERTREIYNHPMQHSMVPEDSLQEPPRVKVRGTKAQVMKLLHKLDATDRLALFSPTEVRMQHRSGCFSLIKNQTKDRFILDSRPHNILEEPLNAFTQTMGAVQPLLDIYLREGEDLQANCEDLRDYYYLYSVSRERAARNALAWSLTAAEASQFRAFKTARAGCANYIPALSTMAMGDVNAVEIGQQAHVLLAAGIGIQRGDLITLRGRMPRQHFAVGIIIDDFVVVERVPRNIADAGIGADIAKLMVEEYRRVGLSPNDDKRVKDSKQPQFWGISIDGEEGILRPQVERVLPIAMLTAKVARLGVANRKLLEVLAGSWISILSVRRRAMCLLSSIFNDIQDYDYDTIFTMRASTVSELRSVDHVSSDPAVQS